MSKIATREAYGLALLEVAKQDDSIVVLDADLSGATKTSYVKKELPEQFFNAGIAEANMVTMAAGFATSGLKPFASSFAMFLAGRAFEQVRNSIAYPHLNVKLCATHAGITVGEDGATHQCNEDMSLMRTLPGMVVLQPCDAIETREMVKFMANYEGPCYMRTSRMATESVHDSSYKFILGNIECLEKGNRVALLASGVMVQEAKKAIDVLVKLGIQPSLYNVPTIKPINEQQVQEIFGKYSTIITLEEHSMYGGLYSTVCELSHGKCNIVPIAIKDTFGESGTPEELMRKYKIDAEEIVKTVLNEI